MLPLYLGISEKVMLHVTEIAKTIGTRNPEQISQYTLVLVLVFSLAQMIRAAGVGTYFNQHYSAKSIQYVKSSKKNLGDMSAGTQLGTSSIEM